MSDVPNAGSVRESDTGGQRKRRKLDLEKCHRCRSDKQKCTPVNRIWPAKCDRCAEKRLPCSKGERVERISKHAPKIISQSGLIEEEGEEEFEVLVKKWHFLYQYHEILSREAERFEARVEELTFSFKMDRPNGFLESDRDVLPSFIKDVVEPLLSRIKKDLLSTEMVHPKLPASILPMLIWQTPHTNEELDECAICDDVGADGTLLWAFQHNNDVCGEYSFRQDRLSPHLRYHANRLGWVHMEEKKISKCVVLSLKVLDSASILFSDLGMPGASEKHEEVKLLFQGRLYRNAFHDSRTSVLFYYMDSLLQPPDADIFEMLLSQVNLEEVKKEDILGRSPLHIAACKDWESTVQVLLSHGADPSATTSLKSLPLHYAAANGSLGMCRKLIDGQAYDINALDIQGHSALHYATVEKHADVVELLSRRSRQQIESMAVPALTEHSSGDLRQNLDIMNTLNWDDWDRLVATHSDTNRYQSLPGDLISDSRRSSLIPSLDSIQYTEPGVASSDMSSDHLPLLSPFSRPGTIPSSVPIPQRDTTRSSVHHAVDHVQKPHSDYKIQKYYGLR